MDTSGKEADVSNDNVPESISSGADIMREIESAVEAVEIDVQYSSEKSGNLNMLMMCVETRESDYEAFISDEELMLEDSAEKVLELDLLCGILDSEVNELQNFMSTLQADIAIARKHMFTYENSGENLENVGKTLQICDESLMESLEQVSYIKMQSSNIQWNLLRFSGEGEGSKVIELLDDNNTDQYSNIKMETTQQQRYVLLMLDKSIARELDLEKMIVESREVEEDLKLRLHSLEHENLCTEEEDLVFLERLSERENTAEDLMGISKDLLGQIQKMNLKLNSLKSKLEDSIQETKAKDTSLQRIESSNTKINEELLAETNSLKADLLEAEHKLVLVDSKAFTLREKVSSLETQLKEYDLQVMSVKTSGDENQDLFQKLDVMSSTQVDLKEKTSKAESRADSAEAKCKLLTESNIKLNEELNLLKASGNITEREDIVLQHAVASAEASQEKQNMLRFTIKDMENVIDNLKLKVSKTENLAESAEDKFILLSKSNSELNEELRFLRGKMDCLEESLHQAEESKKATAKDIRIRSKRITDLVMQLASERERLQKQISSLTKQNKILVNQAQQTSKSQVNMSHNVKEDKDNLTSTVTMRNSNSSNMDKEDEIEVGPADSRLDFETVRNIDARQLNVKYVIMMVLVLVIAVFAALLFRPPDSEF